MALRQVLQQLLLVGRKRGGVLEGSADVGRCRDNHTTRAVGADRKSRVERSDCYARAILVNGDNISIAHDVQRLRKGFADLLRAS